MSIPKHLAIIMDGNGRWAKARQRARIYGHIKGTRVAKKIITRCSDLGIKNLTLYAFSTENWFRPQSEVQFLMTLLERYLKKETDNLVRQNIRFSTIGEISRLPKNLIRMIEEAIEKTSSCSGLNLIFALSYGSRAEIAHTVQNLCHKVSLGELRPEDIDESMINSHLSTYPIPDPDLIIRTSGEQRLSNFLMWQSAYSELYFTTTLWPDFSPLDLQKAFDDFERRQRRFGKVDGVDEKLHH